MHVLSRRRFLQLGALTGLSFYLGFPRLPAFAAAPGRSRLPDSPIRDLPGGFASTEFNGDDFTRPHEILWDVEGYIQKKGGRPATYTERGVVVVGGGMAGLVSAYLLRDQNPLVIEQAQKMGGNSQGERYQGTAFSIGAAYVTVPDAGSDIEKFFRELDLLPLSRKEEANESRVLYQGVKDLWEGGTDPAARASAQKVMAELSRIYEKSFPNIPWNPGDPLSLDQLKAWDRQTAEAWLNQVDPTLHPHVKEYFQLYAWSSFGGSLEEISAAQFVNFVAAETVGVVAFPGGNAAIATALHEKLAGSLPAGSVRSGSLVLEVKAVEGGVEVLLDNPSRSLERIRARTVVMAAPKYVASAVVKGVDAERTALWRRLPYRAYLVANVLLKTQAPSAGFDLYCLKGTPPPAPRFGHPSNRAYTDVIFADWAAHDQNRSVLTFYRPLPFDGARNTLFDSAAYTRTMELVKKELPKTLADLGLAEDAVEAIRLTRWGHAIPLAGVGRLADGTIDQIGASAGAIHFANQDNYLNPAFESAFAAAKAAAEKARASLRG